MSKYFVIDFKRINTQEAYKNIVVGHNNRKRNYKDRINIDTSKSKDNIVLQKLKYKSARELINSANQKIKEENEKIRKRNESVIDKKQKEKLKRGLKKGSNFIFNIVVDCSVIPGWQESNYIEYLKEAEQWLRNKFQGQEVISSVIHRDESKPHLHISFSYYNIDLNKWNQRGLKEQKLTNLNILLKDFERDIGKKYGLKKGDNVKLKKELSKEFKGTKYRIKTGFLKTEEKILINKKNLNNAIDKIYKRVKEIGTEKRYQEEIIRLKQQHQQEIQELKNDYDRKVAKLERTNKELLNIIDKDIQEHNKELQKTTKYIKSIEEKHKKELYEKNMLINQLQDKVKELESLIPPKKQDFKGLDF